MSAWLLLYGCYNGGAMQLSYNNMNTLQCVCIMGGMNLSDREHANRKAYQLSSLKKWRKDRYNEPEDFEIIARQIECCNDASDPYGELVGWARCAENAPGMLDTLRSLRASCTRRLEEACEYNYPDIVESYTAELEDIDVQIHGVSRVAAMVKRGGAPMLCAHADDCD